MIEINKPAKFYQLRVETLEYELQAQIKIQRK